MEAFFIFWPRDLRLFISQFKQVRISRYKLKKKKLQLTFFILRQKQRTELWDVN